MPDIDVGTRTFAYAEVRTGTRQIKIWIKGDNRGAQQYKFDPDPHGDDWYNKNQAAFYRTAATKLAEMFNTKGSFPRYGKSKIEINKTTYALNEPPK